MPNWCDNSLTLTHEDPEMISKAAAGFSGDGFLKVFMPIPQELVDTEAAWHSDPVKQAALKVQEDANIAKYGYKNWYDWSVANWGIKWDISGEDPMVSDDGKSLTVYFQSAWSPPIEAYRVLESRFDFNIEAYYHEMGMCFYGEYSNGHEETVNYSKFSEIPDEIVDMFGLEDWEDEEEAEGEGE